MFWNSRRAAPIGSTPDSGAQTLADEKDLRDAYERGREDERRARKRHPLGMTLMVLAAAVGGIVLTLAATEGSFARGGDIVDSRLAVAADQAEPAVREAAGDAGAALKDAGRTLRDKASSKTNAEPG